MRYRLLAIGSVLAGCTLLAVTSCTTDEPRTEAGLAPSVNPAVAAVSAYDIVKVPSMNIDGNLSDWANVAAISMQDNSGRSGGVDNSASVKLAWNDTYLYAAYNITDTELLALQTLRDHADIFKDDEVELYLDPQGDGATATSMTATDYQFLANVRNAMGDYKGNGTGGKDASYNAASFLAQAVANGTLNAAGTDVGYTVELRISWSDLGVTPAAGHFMRLDLAVGDRDGTGSPTEEFDWAGLTNFNNPSAWKDVKLVNPPPPVSAYDIVKIPGTGISVDGNLSDWAGVASVSMADDPTNGRGTLNNSASVKLAWNDTYLYAAYNITDTELLALQTLRDHADIFKDDEVELYLDPQGDGATATSMTATDYQFLANVRNAMGDYKGNGTGGKDASYNAASFLAQAVANGTLNAAGTDVGYTVELRISWSDLGVTPAAGHFMRLDLAVGDRDGTGSPTEEFDWAGLTNFNNPSAWKDVKLSVDASAPATPTNPTLTVVSSSRIDFSWSPSSSSDVAKYNIYRGTTGTPTLLTSVSGSPYQDTGLAPGTYSYQVSAVDAAGNESDRTAQVTATIQPPPSGIPYGLWALNSDSLPSGTIWTGGTSAGRTRSAVLGRLAAARAKSPRLGMWFNMTGPNEFVFRTDPSTESPFKLQAWKDTLDANHGGTIQPDGTSGFYQDYLPYIQDGTFQGIIMMDDLAGFEPDLGFADIEAMAAHVKKRFPTLTTAVRQRATVLETQADGRNGAPYTKLDAAWAQFRSDQKPASDFRDDNIAAAQRLGLRLVLGMNIKRGYFDGSAHRDPMPVDSILVWGSQLLEPGTSDYACGFYMWDSGFIGLSSPVFTTLADKAKSHVASPCKR